MRVCVLGAGIVGASIAYELAGRDVEVVLVDGTSPGSGATAVSFAWVNANAKLPREYFDLNVAGMREYARLADELPHRAWLHRGGRLATVERVPDLDAHVRRLVSWGYAAEILDARTVAEEVAPAARLGDPDTPVGWFSEEFCVDAVPLTRLLVAESAARGVVGHFGAVVDAVTREGGSFAVHLADGTSLVADAVVNATGAAASGVGGMVASPVPLASTWGMTVLVHAPDRSLRQVVHTADVELRPEGLDRVRLHDTTLDDLLPHADRDELASTMLGRATRVMPALASARMVSTHVGLRPIPADGVSSVGAVPSVPGHYEAVTHSGVTLGPLLGRLLATEIVDGAVDPLLRPFRPDRFTGR
ncbi:MAG: FAD-binding oxidoreductase [Acidothermales bacterium]|nr:FAD-binding oxidoreductase [Acidothermales bacterium]